MTQKTAPTARRTAASVGLLAVLASVLFAPVAAHAAPPDIAVVPSTPITGAAGATVGVQFAVVNRDAADAAGPITVAFDVRGSDVVSASVSGGTCAPSALTCQLPSGLPAAGQATLALVLRLAASGSVQANAFAAADVDSSNNVATAAVTVTAARPAVVTLRGPAKPVRAGAGVRLSGTLADADGAPLPFEPAVLLRKDVGAADFVQVGSTLSDGSGNVSWFGTVDASATYRLDYAPTDLSSAGAAQSLPLLVRVSFAVDAAATPIAVPPGSIVTLSFGVLLGARGSRVTVQQRLGTGPWKTLGHPLLGPGGRAQLRLPPLAARGTYTFRVIRGADAAHVQGEALTRVVVTTTGKGPATAWAPLNGTKARPARWNPCAPITYYVNPRHMPRAGLADLREALRRVSMASGLTFRYGGNRADIPTARYRPQRGSILVAWSTPAESRGLLDDDTGGLGAGFGFGNRIMAGMLVVNVDHVRSGDLPPGFGAGTSHGMVLMHEIGHVIGLAHVVEKWSVMHPSASLPAAVWGAGDLAGLRAVGRPAGCL